MILQDTTEFSFKRTAPEKIGFTRVATGPKDKDRRRQKYKICGLPMHASLAIQGNCIWKSKPFADEHSMNFLVLSLRLWSGFDVFQPQCGRTNPNAIALPGDHTSGLAAWTNGGKFWSRPQFNGCDALKRKINPTRVPIDQKESMRWLDNLRRSTELMGTPERCVHIGDRESDIFELFCLAQDLGPNFLVRSCVNRLAEDGDTTISQVMSEAQSSGTHEIAFHDVKSKPQQAVPSIKFTTMTVRPPIGKQRKYQHRELQIIHAEEVNPPADRPAIFWKLITNLPVENHDDAIHKLGWYARRWSIETFFKTLKTGCRIEDVRLTTADRLANYIALCCIVAWRISWLTILRRQAPTTAPAAVFAETERLLLERKMPSSRKSAARDLAFHMTAVARLGGYLDRNSDPPPGTTVIWRGFTRLSDLGEGFRAAKTSN